ncbi:hypothetical protein BGX27_002621 [Mortierella sp. AM989]|nr:hypothetical protein BGX27_002621 [Mortierella sp. AM989]
MVHRTQTQEDTRNVDSDLLVPDFSTITVVERRELSVVLLEGKVASNKVFQIWEDRTKLGMEMKMALDSILKLLPEDDVCVVGILLREPLVEFFSMQIYAEGVYILRRFATSYIPADPMNMLPIVSLMEAFQHVQTKVKKTVAAIRRVKPIFDRPDFSRLAHTATTATSGSILLRLCKNLSTLSKNPDLLVRF